MVLAETDPEVFDLAFGHSVDLWIHLVDHKYRVHIQCNTWHFAIDLIDCLLWHIHGSMSPSIMI